MAHQTMTVRSAELLNVATRVHDTESIFCPAVDPGSPSADVPEWSIRMHRLTGGYSDGVDVVTLNNGRLTLEILPTRGMGVWRGLMDGIPVGWNSPVEHPVHPSWVDPMRRGGIGWLDGFNEFICRCGLRWNGAPGTDMIRDSEGRVIFEEFLPLHGRIANLPAHHVTAAFSPADNQLSVTGIVDEASVFGGRLRMTSTLSTTPGSSSFAVCDLIENRGSSPQEMELLYHCNIGEPFLETGSVFHTASSEVAPRDQRAAEGISMWNLFEGPSAGYAEQVYFMAPAADDQRFGHGILTSADSRLAVGLRFDTSTLPYLTLWKNTAAREDGCVAGLEPGSGFPNNRMVERKNGRVTVLQPGETLRFRLWFDIAVTSSEVRQLLDPVTQLQVRTPRTVYQTPRPGWGG